MAEVPALCSAVHEHAPEAHQPAAVMPAGDHPITRQIVHAMQKRCDRIERQLATLHAVPDDPV